MPLPTASGANRRTKNTASAALPAPHATLSSQRHGSCAVPKLRRSSKLASRHQRNATAKAPVTRPIRGGARIDPPPLRPHSEVAANLTVGASGVRRARFWRLRHEKHHKAGGRTVRRYAVQDDANHLCNGPRVFQTQWRAVSGHAHLLTERASGGLRLMGFFISAP